MGFYPKHLRRRREHFKLRVIANAALAGATFEKELLVRIDGEADTCRWMLYWPATRHTGGVTLHATKHKAAAHYLGWFYAHHGILPTWSARFNARRGKYAPRRPPGSGAFAP